MRSIHTEFHNSTVYFVQIWKEDAWTQKKNYYLCPAILYIIVNSCEHIVINSEMYILPIIFDSFAYF
jgi:hypothetical protein